MCSVNAEIPTKQDYVPIDFSEKPIGEIRIDEKILQVQSSSILVQLKDISNVSNIFTDSFDCSSNCHASFCKNSEILANTIQCFMF